MPIKRCSIDGKSGYKWGDEGKCYTGPDAKKKAIKQAIAIGEYASNKISFDYDETLTKKNIQELAIDYISKGYDVYIISARRSKIPMISLADKLGIDRNRIIATGSNKAKIQKVIDLNIDKHYDNNKSVIDELIKNGIKGELV